MIQQVNLYTDIFKQTKQGSAINAFFYGAVAIISLLVAFSIFLLIALNNTKGNIQVAKQNLIQTESRIQLLQAQYPKQQTNKLLTEELSHYQNKVNNLSHVIQLLSDKASDQTQGFSRYFSALARQSIAEIWLTNISINGIQHNINLQGSTYQPEKVALFLQNLHHEAVFQGQSFAKLVMKQAKENKDQIDFSINSTNELSEQKKDD